MTIWYVTTGISLVEKSRCWAGARSPDFEAFDDTMTSAVFEVNRQTEALRAWRDRELAAIAGSADPAQAATDFVQTHFRRECFSGLKKGLLPAELATIWALHDRGKIEPGDEVRFIGGISNWNVAQVLRAAAKSVLTNVRVSCIGPYELDPLDATKFNAGVTTLLEEIETNLQRAGASLDKARFVLTGGYKAVLLALTWRLARSGNLPPGPVIFYTHERAQELIGIGATDDGGRVCILEPTGY